MAAVDLGKLSSIVKDKSRRKILVALKERGPLGYSELLNVLETAHTGKLNYHLRILGDLISKNDFSGYKLTPKGEAAAKMLSEFPTPDSKSYNSFHLSLPAIGKTLVFIGGALLLVDSVKLTFRADSSWPTVFILVLIGFASAFAVIFNGSLLHLSSQQIRDRNRLFGALGIVAAIIGFIALEAGLNQAYTIGYSPFFLNLLEPAVVGFIVSLVGFLLSFSYNERMTASA